MTRIAGIQIEKDSKGRPAYARFNLKKHPEVLELLNKVDPLNDEFEKEWKRGITGDQLRDALHKRIDNWNKK
jgi:hypothetical protein